MAGASGNLTDSYALLRLGEIFPFNDQCVRNEDCRGFLLSEAVKMQVALRRDAMIMCRYSSSPSTVLYIRGPSGLCHPSSTPLTGATLIIAINGT
jgi:hypothetical protein